MKSCSKGLSSRDFSAGASTINGLERSGLSTMNRKIATLMLLLAAQIVMYSVAFQPTSSASLMTLASPSAQPNFQITATPMSLTISASNTANSTITLTSINGLSGSVSLAAIVSPLVQNGPKASLNPASVALTSGGSGTSLLTVSTTTTTANGGYTVMVTGTKNAVSNSVQVSVTIIGGTVGAESVPISRLSVLLPYAAVVVIGLAATALYTFTVRRKA